MTRPLLALILCLALPALACSQDNAPRPPAPPPPAEYFATVRYRILSLRDLHVAQYDALVDHLRKLKFQFVPPLEDLPETDREDRTKDQITGLVPSGNFLKIFDNEHVASVLLVPKTFALPNDPDRQVHVRLELASGLRPEQQFQLSQQVRLQLGLIGFREAPGYDHRGYLGIPYTRVVGVIPANRLTLLVRDLRLTPTNWFDLVVPVNELPQPLRKTNPILVTEVLPDPTPLGELPTLPPREPAFLEKITPDLWNLIVEKEPGLVRVQLIFVGNPSPNRYDEMRFRIRQAAPSFVVEGWFGPVATGLVQAEEVPRLAGIPELSAIRLARYRAANVHAKGVVLKDGKKKALELSGLAELHRQGFRGQGIRLAIIDTDFRGWEKLVADKKLPASTEFVDLAAIPDDPIPSVAQKGNPKLLGHGSHCALAATLAAPEAQLVLVRIAGADPYQMVEAVDYFRGNFFTDAVNRRRDELVSQQKLLGERRDQLNKERPEMLKGFEDERELEINFGFLGPVMGWLYSKRQLHFQQTAYQDRLETELSQQFARFVKMTDGLEKLKGVTFAASAINWQDGYPLGASEISRWLRGQKRAQLLWFQSAGNNRGQAWTGPFRDADKNGVMEFADAKTPLRKGRWNREFNFLGWQPYGGGLARELPNRARVRVSLQWREPHDPDYYFRPGEQDYYLRPLAEMQLRVLRQRDPTLKRMPADSFEEVGRSSRLPVRLLHLPDHTFYEHSVDFVADRTAPFAVQIEKLLPSRWIMTLEEGVPRFSLLKNLVPLTMRPLGVPVLPQLEKNWELRMRLFVEVLDDDIRPLGRAVFLDYATDEGGPGVPADSMGAFTVGAVNVAGQPFVESTLGPPAFQQLGSKQPDLWAYADLGLVPEGQGAAHGSDLAAMFTAGLAASMLSKCRNQERVADLLKRQASQIVRVPP